MSHLTPPPGDDLPRALDAALARALRPPRMPAQLRAGLKAAIVRDAGRQVPEARARLERDYLRQKAELTQQFVQVRRRTLSLVVGSAFAAGACVTAAMPWLAAHLGPMAQVAVASVAALVCIATGIAVAWRLAGRDDPRHPV